MVSDDALYGAGVYGYGDYSVGIYGQSDNSNGVLGISGGGSAPEGVAAGVTGTCGSFSTDGTSNMGVYGSSGSGDGGHFLTNVTGVSGVYGKNSESTGNYNSAGVTGVSYHTSGEGFGSGVIGYSGTTSGSAPSYNAGVLGVGDGVAGVVGYTASGGSQAVYGINTAGLTTTYGSGLTSHGVQGEANSYDSAGVYGASSAVGGKAIGVWGFTSLAGGFAVYGNGGATGTGVFGDNRNETSGGNAAVNGQTADGSGYGGYFANSGSGSQYAGYFNGNVKITGCLDITSTGGGSTGTCSSDERLKRNIEPLTSALDRLTQLRGVTYEWKDQTRHAGPQTGFIAQDVEKVFPEWVGTDREGFKTLGLPPTALTALEVEALKSLKLKNDALEARVSVLENGGHPAPAGLTRFVNRDNAGWGFGGLMLGLMIANRKKKQAA